MPKDDLSDWGDPGKVSKEEKIRRTIDSWVGTVVSVIGVFVLLYAIFIDRFQNPALLPGATGLIFLRSMAGRGK